jgi:hypothetical protein
MGLRMKPRNETFFPLFVEAGSNVVESAAMLLEFVAAPHERWAELAKTPARHRARRRRHPFSRGCRLADPHARGRLFRIAGGRYLVQLPIRFHAEWQH